MKRFLDVLYVAKWNNAKRLGGYDAMRCGEYDAVRRETLRFGLLRYAVL